MPASRKLNTVQPVSRPWARLRAAACCCARAAAVTASSPWSLISPASPRRVLFWLLVRLDVEHLDLDRGDDLRGAPDQDAAERGEAEGPAAERGHPVQRGHHDAQDDDLDQVGDQRGDHHGLRADPRGPPHHQHAEAEEHDDQADPDQGAVQPLDADQRGAHGDHDRGRGGGHRPGAPDDDGVFRQHYLAPEGSTATTQAREGAPRSWQEPVAAPKGRCGYPVVLTKRITGLNFVVGGLLVKDITKYLTLSLPDRAQFMTQLGAASTIRVAVVAPRAVRR